MAVLCQKPWVPGLERAWNWKSESHPGKWHPHKPLKFCGATGTSASSLTPALSFQVTDNHALTPGLLSDLGVNTSHLILPPATP